MVGRVLRIVVAGIISAVCALSLGCGSGALTPVIIQVLPRTVVVGAPTQTIQIVGNNFTDHTVVLWNGNTLLTKAVNANTLTVTVDSSAFAAIGTVQIQVLDTLDMQQSTPTSLSIVAANSTAQGLLITTATLGAGTVNGAYTQTLQATGGTSPYTWVLTSGTLAAGLTLTPATGAITGVPTAVGTSTFTVSVTDSSSPAQTQSNVYSIVISSAHLSIVPLSLASATVATPYSQTLRATGGTPGYSWTITSGNLPTGLTLAPSGILSGTPTAAGTFNFTATVTDSGNPTQSQSLTTSIDVAPTLLTIKTSSLAPATVNSAYSQTLQANGGTPGYTWTVNSGSLPAGLTLATNGVIKGTPTVAGTFNFTATVTDSGNPTQTQSANLSIVVADTQLNITTSSLAAGTVNSAYSQTLQVSGGTPAYTWSISSGSLPVGLSLSPATGLIAGNPTVPGTSSFTINVTDSSSPTLNKSATFSIVVAGTQVSITTSSLASGTVNSAYSQTLQASGGTPGYTWNVTSGSLPTGLTLAPTGTISGTPTTAGTFTFTAIVTDSGSPPQSKSANFSITVAPTQLSITTSGLASGTINTTYSQTLQASGGTPNYSWSIAAGSLPTGVTLASTGVISGTPTATGTFNFTVTVTDSGSPVQSKSATFSIGVAPTQLTITSSSLAGGTANTPYSQTLQASGGTPAYTWNITSGSLPAGLTLTATTGVISGTPTASGTFNFTVTVTDTGNPVQSKSANTSITVAAASALTITSSSLAGATEGTAYSQTLGATGGTPGYTWTITTGSLPTGLQLAAPTGVISGTPSVSGTFNFTVTVTDSSNPTQSKSVATSIVVAPQHDVVLNWNAPTSTTDPIAGYNIYRATGAGSYVLVNSTLDTQTTYTDYAVVSGATYTYTVKSVDYSNVESVGSNQVTVTIP